MNQYAAKLTNADQREALRAIAAQYPKPLVAVNMWTLGSSLVRKGLARKQPTNTVLTDGKSTPFAGGPPRPDDRRARSEFRLTADGVTALRDVNATLWERVDRIIRQDTPESLPRS